MTAITDSARRLEYLRAIGVDVWVRRDQERDAGRVTRDAQEKIPPLLESEPHHASRVTRHV